MLYYAATIRENKPGSRHRRKIAIEATNRDQAKTALMDKCSGIGYVADLATLKPVTRKEFEKIMNSLLRKK